MHPVSKCPDPNCDAEVDEAEYGSYAWCDECGHALGEVRVARLLPPEVLNRYVGVYLRYDWQREEDN